MRLEVGSSMAGVEMEFYGYPLVNIIFYGQIHYFDWAMSNSELLNYQSVFHGKSRPQKMDDLGLVLF